MTMTMTKTRTRKVPTQTNNRESLLLKKIEGLEAEIIILRNALSEMEEEKNALAKQIEGLEEDINGAWKEYARIEKLYLTARALVNIPESVEGMLFEILKSRFLILDKIAYHGGGLTNSFSDGKPIAEYADTFEWFTNILPPVKESRQGAE